MSMTPMLTMSMGHTRGQGVKKIESEFRVMGKRSGRVANPRQPDVPDARYASHIGGDKKNTASEVPHVTLKFPNLQGL
jgi:hypothetical protein